MAREESKIYLVPNQLAVVLKRYKMYHRLTRQTKLIGSRQMGSKQKLLVFRIKIVTQNRPVDTAWDIAHLWGEALKLWRYIPLHASFPFPWHAACLSASHAPTCLILLYYSRPI
jgi:hypothetical protein